MKKPHTPLLLNLTTGKVPSIVVGLIASTILTGFVWIVLTLENIPIRFEYFWNNAYFIFTVGYIIIITRVVHNSHKTNFHKLLNASELPSSKMKEWEFNFKNHRSLWRESLIALLVGFIHAYFQVLKALFQGNASYPLANISIGVMIILMWVIITQATSIFMRNMNLMNKLSGEIEVDLLNTDQFMPLTKSGITSILGFIGAYSLLFVQGVQITDYDNPAILILAPSIFFMIRNPLKGIRKRVSEAKHKEVQLIDAAIEGDINALKQSRIGNNLKNINVIDLINYKKMVQSTFEIPVNIPTASRFIFYLIIPLLTWIAASVVDKVIDYLIK